MNLEPFSCGGLDRCPECGATGDYALLVDKVRAIEAAWLAACGLPDTRSERKAIADAIDDAIFAIDKREHRE